MIRTALIGLGNIGLLFDENPATDTARSHAKALWKNRDRFELRYAADPVTERGGKLSKLFPNARILSRAEEIAALDDVDLLVVCVPTASHFEVLRPFIEHSSLRHVVLEKPAFASDSEYAALPLSFRDKITMNYVRRFPPLLRAFRERLAAGEFGELRAVRGLYSKGLQNNGSHLIDLLNFLLGAPPAEGIEALGSVPDHVATDPSVSVRLSFRVRGNAVPVDLLAGDERDFSIFELELLCSRARIRLLDFCRRLEIQPSVEDAVSPGYRSLGPAESTATDLPNSMAYLYPLLASHLEGGCPNPAPYSDELWNRALISAILRNANSKGLI